MRIRPLVILAIVALLLASGCATVTFKRGAGPGSMRSDEDACRATSTDETAYTECLRERGWFVAGKAAGAETPASEPETAAEPAAAASSNRASAPATAPAEAPRLTPPAETPRPAPIAAPPAPAPASAPKAAPAAAVKASATTAPPTPADPLSKVGVGSWWKLGGTAADLDRAIATCVDTLGEAHRPSPAATLVTVGLRDCLRSAKWFPVGKPLPQ